jgi:RHS repeat-associated protein
MDNVTRFEYDRLNRLTRVFGNSNQVTIYEYDGRGLVTKVINAIGDAKIYVYDQNGNLISVTDEDGYVTTYEYDVRNLINSISYADGRTANFTNNAAGQLVRVTDWTGETTFTLDLLGRITSVNDPNNRTVSYTYDAAGNQTHITYPDETTVNRIFDNLGRITAIQSTEGLFNYAHDPTGRVTSISMPNGITETFMHDSIGQLLSITQHNPDGTAETLNQYTYDAVGNVTGRTNSPQELIPSTTTQNEFNALNQLTASTERDSTGNIINQLEFTYDRRGNLIQERDTINNTTQTYTFDATNRMTQGINHHGEESNYVYNALGVLTRRNDTDFAIDYTSFVPTTLMEFSNDLTQRHVYGSAGFGLSRISTTLATPTNPNQAETFFIQNDRLGSGRFATDSTGNRVAHTHLDEWGNILNQEKLTFAGNEINILNMFTNHTYDEILGLYYAQARFYDPTQRRFISADPHWGPHNRTNSLDAIQQSGNLYSYTINNPLRFSDPWGRFITPHDIQQILDEARYYVSSAYRNNANRNLPHGTFASINDEIASIQRDLNRASGNRFRFPDNPDAMEYAWNLLRRAEAIADRAYYKLYVCPDKTKPTPRSRIRASEFVGIVFEFDSGVQMHIHEEEFYRAIEYLMQSSVFRDIWQVLQNSGHIITIRFNNAMAFYYHDGIRTIDWNPFLGMQIPGGYMSSAVMLAHEMVHAYLHLTDENFIYLRDMPEDQERTIIAAEEKFIVQNYESLISAQLNEPARDHHTWGDFREMNNSTHFIRTHTEYYQYRRPLYDYIFPSNWASSYTFYSVIHEIHVNWDLRQPSEF